MGSKSSKIKAHWPLVKTPDYAIKSLLILSVKIYFIYFYIVSLWF